MKLEWKNKELLAEIERLQIKKAERAAKYEELLLKQFAPEYEGPPRKGRKAGTLRDGIKMKRLKKWSRVYLPHPAIHVEYGGPVKDRKGKWVGKRGPRPFIRPTLKPLADYFEKLHEKMI